MSENEAEIPEEGAVVDRIEDGSLAVLLVGEEERELTVPVAELPEGGAAEGAWLRVRVEEDRVVGILADPDETARVRERIQGKIERLRRRGTKRE